MRSVSVPTEPAQQRPGWSEALAAVRSNAGQRPSPAAESVPSEPRQPLTQSPEAPSRVISDIETQLDNGESNTRLFLNNAQRRIDDIRTRFQAQIRVDSFWSGSEMERDFMDRQEQAPAQPIPTTDAAPQASGEVVGNSIGSPASIQQSLAEDDSQARLSRLITKEDVHALGPKLTSLAERLEIVAWNRVKDEALKADKASLGSRTTSTEEGHRLELVPSGPNAERKSSLRGVFDSTENSLKCSIGEEPTASFRITGLSRDVSSNHTTTSEEGVFDDDFATALSRVTDLTTGERAALTRFTRIARNARDAGARARNRTERFRLLSALENDDLTLLRGIAMRRLDMLRAQERDITKSIEAAEEQIDRLLESVSGVPRRMVIGSVLDAVFEDPSLASKVKDRFPEEGIEFTAHQRGMLRSFNEDDAKVGDRMLDAKMRPFPRQLILSRCDTIWQAIGGQEIFRSRDDLAVPVGLSRIQLRRLTHGDNPPVWVLVFAADRPLSKADLTEYEDRWPVSIPGLAEQLNFDNRPGLASGSYCEDEPEDFGVPFRVHMEKEPPWKGKLPRELPIAMLYFEEGKNSASVDWPSSFQTNTPAKHLTFYVMQGGTVSKNMERNVLDIEQVNVWGWWGRRSFQASALQ